MCRFALPDWPTRPAAHAATHNSVAAVLRLCVIPFGPQMLATAFNWHAGQVRYWNLDSIDLERSLTVQVDELTKDLAQVVYPGGIILDIGWYPAMDIDGSFVVSVIDNEDWEAPKMNASCSCAPELVTVIRAAIAVASAA